MINGIINVYKETGFTSHDVVAKMRGILQMKKIGHTGTLDPAATGVLPVCLGKGTKLVDLITDKDKTYEAVMKLGITTDTQDTTGAILSERQVKVGFEQIKVAADSFIGEYMQLPPMYSAIKVDGKKLYELARQGKEIERERRRVQIYDIKLLNYREEEQEVTLLVHCSKGTYIRTLIHDIGEKLGCGAAMKNLIRRAVGNFKIEEALKLSDIERFAREGNLEKHVIGTDEMFHDLRGLTVKREYHKLIYNGNPFSQEHITSKVEVQPEERFRVYDTEGTFIGIYHYVKRTEDFRPIKMFL